MNEALQQQKDIYNTQSVEEQERTKAIIEEYNMKRGSSLMEQHQINPMKKLKQDSNKSNERQPFDREKV